MITKRLTITQLYKLLISAFGDDYEILLGGEPVAVGVGEVDKKGVLLYDKFSDPNIDTDPLLIVTADLYEPVARTDRDNVMCIDLIPIDGESEPYVITFAKFVITPYVHSCRFDTDK